MPTPPDPPSGRRPADPPAPGPARPSSRSGTNGGPPADPLSEILRGPGSSRRGTGSDILQALGPANTDDAPTVITQHNPNRPPAPPPPTPLPVSGDPPSVAGRRLGHYELIEAVGSGGMAAVLKARDLELGRLVALKILPPEAARDPEGVTRFRQEARAAARLDHENVARVYSTGEDQGLHFIAFEFVEGVNLRVLIDRRGTVPAAECVGYMIQVAAGLTHAAERGIVHRDIKPSNIVITPDRRAKIVDMGLARQLDAAPVAGGVTQSGVTLGTFDYISPEQALDPRRADVRSDIYSLGCTFYHALTGRPPVPEGTAAKKLHAHQHVDPLDPRQINPLVPDELAAVLARMMAKDPARRYQTPADLIADLKGVALRLRLSPDAVGQDSVVRAVPAGGPVLPQPPRLKLGWALGLAAAGAAVAALALSAGDPDRRPAAPPWEDRGASGKDNPFAGIGSGGPNLATPAADGPVRTAEELATRLADPATTRVELAGVRFDLTTFPGVAFDGKRLDLVGAADGGTVIRVKALSPGADADRAGTLGLKADGAVTVSQVRFEVRPADAEWDAAGLTVTDAADVTLRDCVFVPPVGRPVGSVRVVRSGDGTAKVAVERCVFGPGAFAVALPDLAALTVTDSGFGPQTVAVRSGDEDEAGPRVVAVDLRRSSFLLDPSSAVVGGPPGRPGETVRVTAGWCVFALAGAPAPTARPVLVRAGESPGTYHFAGEAGRKNAYYGVAALGLTAGGEAKTLTFEEAVRDGHDVRDAGAVALARRPWGETDPTAALAGEYPYRAFALGLTEFQLALPDDRNTALIGAQFHVVGTNVRRAYPPGLTWPPDLPKDPSAAGPRTLVWDPAAADKEAEGGTFNDLPSLLRKVRAGDTVRIRHDGQLAVEQVRVKPRAGDGSAVTFEPHPGSAPVLTAAGGEELSQVLFRVQSGAVVFRNLQFKLKPSRPRNPQRVAAAQLLGAESCTFQECAFTLAEEDEGRVAAVLVDDPDEVMMADGANRPAPKVRFDKCVVRGKGRGVWVPVSRPVEVDLVQTLSALDGPVFAAEARGKPAEAARSALRLTRSTVFAGGPVVELKAGRAGEAALVRLAVSADETLFAAVPNAGRPLVELDGVDPADVTGNNPVLARGEWKANRYANFDAAAVVMVARPADGAAAKEWNWDQWVSFAGELVRPVGAVKFEAAPGGLRDLAAVKPADAAVKAVDFPDLPDAKPADAGVSEKLPTPANEP
ncbi:MAG: hypothetical protein C0501_06055 [Isosphaera sp.]|nr:hypothetical protein [Isosphaera sp.]